MFLIAMRAGQARSMLFDQRLLSTNLGTLPSGPIWKLGLGAFIWIALGDTPLPVSPRPVPTPPPDASAPVCTALAPAAAAAPVAPVTLFIRPPSRPPTPLALPPDVAAGSAWKEAGRCAAALSSQKQTVITNTGQGYRISIQPQRDRRRVCSL